jgi:hypothetical protein
MGKVSKSKIYGILKRIYQMGWVHRDYEEDEQARRNSIKMDWAGIWVEEEYDHLVVNKEKRFMTGKTLSCILGIYKKSNGRYARRQNCKEMVTGKRLLQDLSYQS